MQWSSDLFTKDDTLNVLGFFTPQDVTRLRCSVLGRYLHEIPPPHTVGLYNCYMEQVKPAVERAQKSANVHAELWLYALTARTLSFEVEQGFVGALSQFLLPPPEPPSKQPQGLNQELPGNVH